MFGPNITGRVAYWSGGSYIALSTYGGVFSKPTSGAGIKLSGGSSYQGPIVTNFSSQLSSGKYRDILDVQPSSIQTLIIIKV